MPALSPQHAHALHAWHKDGQWPLFQPKGIVIFTALSNSLGHCIKAHLLLLSHSAPCCSLTQACDPLVNVLRAAPGGR